MRKTKSEARWNRLTPKQRETPGPVAVRRKRLGYAAIFPRGHKPNWDLKGRWPALKRYYARRDQERTLTKFDNARSTGVAAVNGAPSSEERSCAWRR